MFKAAVFVVALTLVGGHPAALLCGAWCDQGKAPVMCHHDEAAPAAAAIAAADGCGGSGLWAGPWRETTRRVASGDDRDVLLLSAVHRIARPACSLRSRDRAWSATPLERRPFSAQLRI